MPSVRFTTVDVFSTTPYKGNPLAIIDAREEPLTDTQMRLIARQFNLSETTFFFWSSKADFKLRSFLPDGKEVFGAGHNILGVWWHLAHANLLDLPPPQQLDPSKDETVETFTFHQELGDQITPVKVTRHIRHSPTTQIHFSISLRQATPHFHGLHPDPTSLATTLGISPKLTGHLVTTGNIKAPPQVLSTSSTHHLLFAVYPISTLNHASVDGDTLLEQLRRADKQAYGIYLFTPVAVEQPIQTFQARFFSPGMSGEDPATGSAAGLLAAYLWRHGALKVGGDGVGRIEVHQGLKVGRECVMEVVVRVIQGKGKGGEGGGKEVLEVDLVGSGVRVAEGRMSVPDVETEFDSPVSLRR